MFSEAKDFWILAHIFNGLNFFWVLAHVFNGLKVLAPSYHFQRPMIFRFWLMHSEDQGFLGIWHMFLDDQRL